MEPGGEVKSHMQKYIAGVLCSCYEGATDQILRTKNVNIMGRSFRSLSLAYKNIGSKTKVSYFCLVYLVGVSEV